MVNKLTLQGRDDCDASVINLSHPSRTRYTTEVTKVKGLASLCPDNLKGGSDFYILPTQAHLIVFFLINKI